MLSTALFSVLKKFDNETRETNIHLKRLIAGLCGIGKSMKKDFQELNASTAENTYVKCHCEVREVRLSRRHDYCPWGQIILHTKLASATE